MHAFERIVGFSIGMYIQHGILCVFFQVVRETVQAGNNFELGQRNRRSPGAGGRHLNICFVIYCYAGKCFPLHQVYQVCAYIHNGIALLLRIKEPGGPGERLAGHIFVEHMHAFHYHAGIFIRSLLLVAENVVYP